MSRKRATERLGADDAGIARAVEILASGGLTAIPTETVYGLAARADDAAAVAAIFAAKGRPSFNPLIVHVADMAAAEALAEWDERARLLAGRFWPGPLTLVLPVKPGAALAPAVTGGLETVALRCPAHPVMRAVLNGLAAPLAAPSANRSESVSPTQVEHVLATLDGRIDAVIDGGVCQQGLESTIVALEEVGSEKGGGEKRGDWAILRPGPIGEKDVQAVLGLPPSARGQAIRAPGQMARHYSPGKPVRLGALSSENGEFMLGFGAVAGDWSLSPSGDLAEAASRLYAGLHRAAEAQEAKIAIAPIPQEGLGEAINDRLRRAAA